MRVKDRAVSTVQLNNLGTGVVPEACHASHDHSVSNFIYLASAVLGGLRAWSMAQRKTIHIECWCFLT